MSEPELGLDPDLLKAIACAYREWSAEQRYHAALVQQAQDMVDERDAYLQRELQRQKWRKRDAAWQEWLDAGVSTDRDKLVRPVTLDERGESKRLEARQAEVRQGIREKRVCLAQKRWELWISTRNVFSWKSKKNL
jgi:hypothetical protein